MENKALSSQGAYSIPSAKQAREIARYTGYAPKAAVPVQAGQKPTTPKGK
jgi:hypothetical protein